ncbi:MAG: hypothetical protein OQK75_14115 [Gammaproteobacteria bacterium]|nr:hypothetical protein [Gammaproteobacteria bacterium]MCW8988794.1 hypothetical protein [Gammaproteobacteria bacterium]MCW9031756.1 hypothetical protein [Gammaproteobacteria bacterium]
MSDSMVVLLNGEALFEYDRTKQLAAKQQEYLDRMDQKMDGGIQLGNETIVNPDQQQRAQFVAFTLLTAIEDDNEAVIAAMNSYLATRYPDLKQVKADIDQASRKVMFDLIFDQEHKNQVKVSFNA